MNQLTLPLEAVMTTTQLVSRSLWPNGRPKNPGSFFITFRKEFLRSLELRGLWTPGMRVAIPYLFTERWNIMNGTIEEVHSFMEGKTILLKPDSSDNIKWPIVPIWITNDNNGSSNGSSGVLS